MLLLHEMRVLGIDPGSRYLGLGCVEAKGSSLVWVGHQVVQVFSTKERELDWDERMKAIYSSVQNAIEEWKPQAFAVEEVFMAENAKSALKLGQARGAAIVAAANKGISLFEYSATIVKQTVTGSGRADKQQVQHMVRVLLSSQQKRLEFTREDASDALAIAICHLQYRKFHLQEKASFIRPVSRA